MGIGTAVGLYDDSIYGTTMLLSGVHSGVTHMVFSQDGNYLFIGYRKVLYNIIQL